MSSKYLSYEEVCILPCQYILYRPYFTFVNLVLRLMKKGPVHKREFNKYNNHNF